MSPQVLPESAAPAYAPASESYAQPLDRRVVHGNDVVRTVPLVGSGYRFSNPAVTEAEPVLRGVFETLHLRPGFILQRTDVQDLHDMQTSLTLNPALKIGLVVHGETELRLGSLDFRLGPWRDAKGRLRHRGLVVAFAEPDTFRRQWRAGRREAKVSLTLLPEWLEGAGAFDDGAAQQRLRAFCRRHLAHEHWEPSARALALAQQIVRPPELTGPLLRLYIESRAIELVAEALALVMHEPQAAPPRLAVREHRRMQELRQWLDRAPPAHLTLDQMAQQAGMSAAALQRAFRATTGSTLVDYLRLRRLDAARVALERDGASVAQAAEIAGYTNATNFSTAYKRRFGQTPREARLRC